MTTISILNQIISDEEGTYRVQYGSKIGYLTILADVFDDDTMCRPYLLIPKLPKFPEEDWTRIHISKSPADANASALNVVVTNDPLPRVETLWHSQRIDVLSLDRTKRYRSNVHEVMYNGVPAVCKIAAFDWQIPQLERETWAYFILDRYLPDTPEIPRLSPRILGHVTEQGRVMGLLMERLEGRFASITDLPICTDVIRRLHNIGLIHEMSIDIIS